MAVIGSLIKGLINLGGKIEEDKANGELQEETLYSLLNHAKHTQFGQFYQFEKLLSKPQTAKKFKSNLPFFDYQKIHSAWWHKIHEHQEDVVWPGSPDYFALTSGTTGKESKQIPVTNAMLEDLRKTAIQQIMSLSNFDLPSDFFEKEILMLGSSTKLALSNEDFMQGEISGISASNIPFWFSGYYKPGEEIAKIEDWDQRVLKIAENAKQWDIGAISGIPTWIELMMKKVIEYHNLKHIHEIWPNFKVYTSGGVAFQPYEKSFKSLLGKPVEVIDTYLASEGFIAFQQRPDTNAMKLSLDTGIYFEFIPFEADYLEEDGSLKNNAPSLSINEVEEKKDYVLVISTNSGLWRYMIGDTIQFTNVEKAEIIITGRTKFFLNVAGSQLSVNKMNEAIQAVEKKFDIKIPEFLVGAVKVDQDFEHHWFIGGGELENIEEIKTFLDNYLKEANKNYRVARNKALKNIQLKSIPVVAFYDWAEQSKKKGGQMKIEKVMKEKKLSEFKEFIKSYV